MPARPEWIYGARWLKRQQRAKLPREPTVNVSVKVRRNGRTPRWECPGQLLLWMMPVKQARA
jgi:hypothetical protein